MDIILSEARLNSSRYAYDVWRLRFPAEYTLTATQTQTQTNIYTMTDTETDTATATEIDTQFVTMVCSSSQSLLSCTQHFFLDRLLHDRSAHYLYKHLCEHGHR
jgi:carbohydrate-binding DOMON domain-containing protein